MHLFVGLGNPGKKYAMTRHNIGFMVLKELATHLNWEFKEKTQFRAWLARGEFNGNAIHLLMPATYMNESGYAVRRYMDYAKIEISHLVVISDDIALPFGEIRLRSKGSSGGHNGLKSIETHLGTQQFARLRMGIGHHGISSLADYVLENFTKEEQTELLSYLPRGEQVLKQLMDKNITDVMKTVNTKPQNGANLKT